MKKIFLWSLCTLLAGCSPSVRSDLLGMDANYQPSNVERFEGEAAPKAFNPFKPKPKPAPQQNFASYQEPESYFMPSMLIGTPEEKLEQALTMVRKDSTMGKDAMEHLVEAGNAGAMYNMGIMYLNGQGVKKDQSKGLSYIRRAADLGYVSATTAMGSMYLQGSGVNRNPAQAKNYFLKGAQKGDAQSMMYLSMMHAKGDGVEQSNQEAYRWLLSMPDSAMNTNIKQNQEQFAGMLSAEEQQLAKHRAQAFKIQYGIK